MSLLCSIPTARWMAAAGDLDQAGIPVPAIRRYSPAAIDSSRERYAGSSTSNGVGFWASAKSPPRKTTRSLYPYEESTP
jgi:hypothetical protein